MKKIFIATLFLMLQCGTIFASVGTNTDNGGNYKMSYPIVYTENKISQDKINQDIYHYIAAFRDDYNAGKFFEGHFNYDLKFENNEYVSLTVTDYRYNRGAAHGFYYVYGLVYDKNSGKKIPLSNFLKISLNDLKQIYSGHLYDGGGKLTNGFGSEPKEVSKDYYLLGNGGIALIYQPYALASYADGATTIRLSAKEVDYFNRKNR